MTPDYAKYCYIVKLLLARRLHASHLYTQIIGRREGTIRVVQLPHSHFDARRRNWVEQGYFLFFSVIQRFLLWPPNANLLNYANAGAIGLHTMAMLVYW